MKNQDLSVLKALLLREMNEGSMCNECGGPMYEGVCMECGYMEEALHGGQNKLDVAPPFGKLTGADFKKLRGMKKEDHEGTDHEVSMANNSLDSILWAANELKKYLGDQERDIPAWIQDHITNAENYILQAAKNFHDYGDHEERGDSQDMSLASLMEAKKKPVKEMVKKVGNKHVVYSKKGKKLGTHTSRAKANKQMAAIEISKQGK